MDDIENYARKIQAKHALFVFDSCFSGKLVEKSEILVPPFVIENVARPVRQFITSGSADQTVPDDSLFRKLFVRGLDGEADEDNDGFLLGSELAKYLMREVTNYRGRIQTPQYNKILDVDLNLGDFVFVVGKGANPNPVRPAIPQRVETKQSISKTLAVSNFTKTDICATPGMTLSITANGTINFGQFIQNATPAGKDSFELGLVMPIDKKYNLERDFPHGALMCRFDYENKWSYCSTSYTLKAEKAGCLIFEVNDNEKQDNRGEFKVTVKSL
jgi:hypothetical protein